MEIDFLGEDLPEGDTPDFFSEVNNNVKEIEVLIWHKVESQGHRPGARTGHTMCGNGKELYLFGGIEAGFRMDTTHSYNVLTGHWTWWDTKGDVPCSRAWHASCCNNKYMFVQGGEIPLELLNSKEQSNDVTIGDSIKRDAFMNTTQVKKSNNNTKASGYCCVDDLYCLNIETKTWTKTDSSLAPLPRKGHSLSIAKLKLKPGIAAEDYLLLFGGLSTGKYITGNSIHLAKCNDISSKKSVAWRQLNCSGEIPPPRYMHSSTLLHSSAQRGNQPPDLFVIYGGIDEHHKVLSDIYILNLETFVWKKGSPGGIEVPPAYAHTAFPAPAMGMNIAPGTVRDIGTHSLCPTCLVIFGGSSSSSNAADDTLDKMYVYDVLNETWSEAGTGWHFPSQRSSHAAAIITGWAPENALPGGNIAQDLTTYGHTDQTHSTCAIVFGGLNSVSHCKAETWALDLQWRPRGVKQFDNSLQNITHMELMQMTGGIEGEKMNLMKTASESSLHKANLGHHKTSSTKEITKSESMKDLSNNTEQSSPSSPDRLAVTDKDGNHNNTMNDTLNMTKTTMNTTAMMGTMALTDTFNNDVLEREDELDLDEIGNAIHRVRKDRILADVHYRKERARAEVAEAAIEKIKEDAAKKVAEAESKMEEMQEEVKQLRGALEESVKRCQYLAGLNEEAYKLLMLQGSEKEFLTQLDTET